ncbi:uncharacterized protein LOC107047929 [Diachasma alloeum]|uniref:uncharacterized protein LOC107047929 n=1 Tax=Diachasma alloeum TaxID=454923 RepID=UPI0007384200|nr:uncharacterized protein LOC107047929 [Diachasma alloeum]
MAMTMEAICERKPTRCLKVPLKSTEQICLVFLIPAVIGCCIYMVHFAADLVVAVQHFREGNPIWGGCTLGLMYAPAVAYFILTVSRPDWWMTEDQKISWNVVTWFGIQIVQMIAFPLFALYRFAGQIVVIVDAILLSGVERRKSLNVAAAPAAIELYFFLQAWFQAAPQAILQIHLLFRERTAERTYQSVSVHILCILVSIIVLAVQTASFQRFESQRINGRKLPWAMWLKKYRTQELGDLDEKKPLQPEVSIVSSQTTSPPQSQVHLQETEAPRVVLERQISLTPPLPPKNAQMIPPPAPLRGITTVAPLPVPEMPAPPRPDSVIRESIENDVEAPDRSTERIVTVESNDSNASSLWRGLRLPKRIHSVKAIAEDDPVGIFIAFLWWFFFIVARVFSIAIFYEFYPIPLAGVIGVHYIVMLIYLFVHAKDYDVTTFFVNLWLGLVYICTLIEYRVKFKHPDKWLWFYCAFVMAQNTTMTATWFALVDWDGFWYSYMFYAIFGCMGLCIVSGTVYYVLFKPGKRRIYAS